MGPKIARRLALRPIVVAQIVWSTVFCRKLFQCILVTMNRNSCSKHQTSTEQTYVVLAQTRKKLANVIVCHSLH